MSGVSIIDVVQRGEYYVLSEFKISSIPLASGGLVPIETSLDPLDKVVSRLSPDEILTDIILVHGLEGNPFREGGNPAWQSKESQTVWIRDLLPRKIKFARLHLYEYDTTVLKEVFGEDLNRQIRGHSLCLLKSIYDTLGAFENKTRITPIGNGFGGLIVKQAVIFSAQDTVPSLSIGAHKGTDGSEREAFDVDLPVNRPDFYVSEACYKFSKTHIVGITFLGTPHRGWEVSNGNMFYTRASTPRRPRIRPRTTASSPTTTIEMDSQPRSNVRFNTSVDVREYQYNTQPGQYGYHDDHDRVQSLHQSDSESATSESLSARGVRLRVQIPDTGQGSLPPALSERGPQKQPTYMEAENIDDQLRGYQPSAPAPGPHRYGTTPRPSILRTRSIETSQYNYDRYRTPPQSASRASSIARSTFSDSSTDAGGYRHNFNGSYRNLAPSIRSQSSRQGGSIGRSISGTVYEGYTSEVIRESQEVLNLPEQTLPHLTYKKEKVTKELEKLTKTLDDIIRYEKWDRDHHDESEYLDTLLRKFAEATASAQWWVLSVYAATPGETRMDTVRKHSAVLDLPMENVLELAVTHDDLTRHENDSQEYQKLEAIIQALIHDDLPNPQGSAKRRKSKSLKRQVIDEGEAKALIEPHFPINKDVPAHMLTITHEYCESSGWYYHNIQEENFSLRELDERIQSDCERPKISIPDNSHQYQKSYDNAAEMVKPLQSSNLGVETDSASHNHVRKDPDASFEKEIIKAELERVYEELRRVKSEPREKAQTRNYTGWRDPWSTYQPSYETESGESFAFEDRQKQRSLLELRLRRLLLMEKLAEMIDNIRILSDSGGHDKGESNDQRKEQQEFEEGDQEEDNGKETQQEEVQQARVENQREEYCQTDDKGQQQNKRESKPRRDMEQALDSGDEFRTTLGAHSGSGGHNGSEIGLSRSSIDGEEHRISSLGTSPAAARLPQTYQHTYVLPALKDRYLAYRSGNGDHGEFGSETKDTEFNDRDTEYSYEVLNTDFDSDSDSGTLGYEIDGGFTWIHVPGNDRSWVEAALSRVHSAKNPTIPLLILQDDFWGCKEQYHKYSNGFSHAFMEPSCNITFVETKRGSASLGMSPERYHQLAIYLPYIHWSDNKQQKAEAKALEAFHLAPESLKEEYEQSKKDPRTRLQSFALLDSGKHRHHPRRTLDQYYYRHGTDTKSRDSDQIVLHGTGGQKLLMVDQLWVFVTSPDTIFTFFPKNNPPKGAADLQDIDTDVTNSETAVNFEFADLQKCMQESLSGNKSKMKALFPNAFAMAANCLYFSVKVLMSKTDHDGFSVMQSFQEAMAVTKEEAVKLLDAFILNPRAADVNIDEELKLLRKAADLEDELGIIHHLFHEQLRVVKSFIHQIKRMDSITPNLGLRKAQSIARDTQDILKEYLNGIEQQQVVARDTWGFILHCIDLKQTGASLQEARVTRRIAITSQEEQKTNSKQSRTMMIFTVFTVVFLPLGFFTSLYGMNIKEWSGEETNISGKTAMLYMVLISAFIISIALTVAFRFNELRGFIFGQRPPARSPRDPEPGMGEERRGRHGDHEMAPLHERRDLRGGGLEV